MKTKKIIAGLLIVFIAVSLYWFPQFKNDLVQIDNQESVVDSIVSLKGYHSVNVVKEKKYNDYYAVLYYRTNPNLDSSEDNLELLIYKKVGSSNNYAYYGGASSTNIFDTFNLNDKGQETIIIVYGDNQQTKAYSYCIKNSGVSYKKDIDPDFVLDIYIIYDTDDCSSANELLDINDKVIETF